MLSSVILALVFASCSGDDGTDGLDGIDGIDGVDGAAGADGANGADGADGVANASVLLYDVSALSGNSFSLNVPEFTPLLLATNTILIYAQIGSSYYPIPGALTGTFSARPVLSEGGFAIYFYRNDDGTSFVLAQGIIDSIKVVTIESSSYDTRVAKSATSKDILSILKADGVDVNDYNAVAAYFNL